MRMGLPPDFTRCTTSVFRPMAAMAMTMKNFDSVLSGSNSAGSAPADAAAVVMTEAAKNSTMNRGSARRKLKLPSLPAGLTTLFLRASNARGSRLSRRAIQMPKASVMGMIASVRVSFTMVA